MYGRIVDLEVKPFMPPTANADLGDLFMPLRHHPYAMLLLSGGELDCAGYSIMGWEPCIILRAKGNKVRIRVGSDERTNIGNPFDILRDLLGELALPGASPVYPVSAGGLGFLAYDLKNHLERLPVTVTDDLALPEMVMAFPTNLIVHDRRAQRFWEVRITYEDAKGRLCRPSGERWWRWPTRMNGYRVGGYESNFTREGYLAAVRRIREYIRQGHVYQVNLSQRFSFYLTGEAYGLFRRLFALNPAPFFAYLNCGHFHILSTSMERFLFRQGEYLETRPIKGTRPRGETLEEDEEMRRELAGSVKDDAELSMIVDLLRNDLGKVCQPRTVKVKEHKRVEAYQNVYHLVSIVTGSLRAGTNHMDIVRATFPGGSITGCPKIRAMEIIDELEPHARHVYTGAIGYLGLHDNLDLNIAIRTAIITRGRGYFSVGGGVVYDSDEVQEYEETLHKGRTLFQLMGEKRGADDYKAWPRVKGQGEE